jgi:uncharacterized membrane protein
MVTAAKTTSQIAVHMGVAFATMYVITGSFAVGGIAAVIEPICNVIIMPLHEKLWERIRARVNARRAHASANPSARAHGRAPQPA